MLSTRLARNCLLARLGSPACLPSVQAMATMKPISPEAHKVSQSEFWAKNAALKRPISPHLTIYKFQLTSILSITHRMSGLAQSGMLAGMGLVAVALPGSFPSYLAMLQEMHFGGAIIFTTKFILAWPVFFHLFNGFRHLALRFLSFTRLGTPLWRWQLSQLFWWR